MQPASAMVLVFFKIDCSFLFDSRDWGASAEVSARCSLSRWVLTAAWEARRPSNSAASTFFVGAVGIGVSARLPKTCFAWLASDVVFAVLHVVGSRCLVMAWLVAGATVVSLIGA